MSVESPNSGTGLVGNTQPVTTGDLEIVTGQTLYVPAYSEIFYGSSQQTMPLTVTLTIHNTDLNHSIIVKSVRYYDTDGNLVTEYVPEPVQVAPLATIGYVVSDDDRRGGWGANFIVEWGGEQPVYQPIVEALMVSTQGTHGISMISAGRVLAQTRTRSTSTPAPIATATTVPG